MFNAYCHVARSTPLIVIISAEVTWELMKDPQHDSFLTATRQACQFRMHMYMLRLDLHASHTPTCTVSKRHLDVR